MKSNKKNIMFSIIIPVYNLEDCVSSVLESIQVQHYNDYEVIIIDDGSTDQTSVICHEWCKKHSRFRLVKQANGGGILGEKSWN